MSVEDIRMIVYFCCVLSAITCAFNMVLFFGFPALKTVLQSIPYKRDFFQKYREVIAVLGAMLVLILLLILFCALIRI